MLGLLHIPSSQLVKFSFTNFGVRPPVVDLEFIYKNEFYRGDTGYSFSVWLEKTLARIVAGAMSKAFYDQNKMLEETDVVHAEFSIVKIEAVSGHPNMNLDLIKIHESTEFLKEKKND